MDQGARMLLASSIFVVLVVTSSKINAQPGRASKPDVSQIPRLGASSPATPVDDEASAAKRLAECHARALKGEIPIFDFGASEASRIPEIPPPDPPYRGTTIAPDSEAEGVALRVQEEFAAMMSRVDPVPASRLDHFAWLPPIEHVRLIGWSGGVLESEAQADGSWVMKVRIYPWLYSPYMRTAVFDHVDETYKFSNGMIEFLGSDAHVPKPELQIFPPVY